MVWSGSVPRGHWHGFYGFWTLVALAGSAVAATQIETGSSFGETLAAAIGAAVSLSLVVTLAASVGNLVIAGRRQRALARDPRRAVAFHLARVYGELGERVATGSLPRDLASTASLTRHLEAAAAAVEHNLLVELRPDDPATRAWLEALLGKVAAGIRSWKRELLSPGPGSDERLLGELRDSLAHVIEHEWSLVKQAEPFADERGTPRARVRALAAGLLWGALPVGALVLLQHTSYRLDGATAHWATVTVALWALVSVLGALDPRFADKIEAMKNLSGLLPQSKPKP
jgi:hypothetical protein